jgi:hypothetical protein
MQANAVTSKGRSIVYTKIAMALVAALLFDTASTASASVHSGRQGARVHGRVRASVWAYPTGVALGYAYPGYAYPYAYGAQIYNRYIANLGDAGVLPGPND